MRRLYAMGFVLFVLVLCAGCAGTPTPTPSPVVTPSSTPLPPPTATPTPLPPRASIDLGLPAGDTYSVAGGVMDKERDLLYILGHDGDANSARDLFASVLTVVNLADGQVRATVPLTMTVEYPPSAALSADGSRLYVTGRKGYTGDFMAAVSTGAAGGALGEITGTFPGVRALALDAEANRLYVADNQRILRRLDALTLKEEAFVGLPEFMSPTMLVAANPKSGRVYVGGSGDSLLASYRADDLSLAGYVELSAQAYSIAADPNSDRTYVVTQAWTQAETIVRVAVIQGDKVTAYWNADKTFPTGRVIPDEAGRVLLLEDEYGVEQPRSRIRTVNAATGETLSAVTIPSVNLQYSAGALLYRGVLYRLADVVLPIRLDTGQVGTPIQLGVGLVAAALDEDGGQLFVVDSTGALHTLEVPSLKLLRTWPRVLDPGLDKVWSTSLTYAGGRLYVADHKAGVTLVMDAATGEKTASIPKAGQVSVDPRGGRLFVTNQGVFIADAATFQITDSISETVRSEPKYAAPGALEAQYDADDDLLFVTMSNNVAGSSYSTWLQIYDGKTLGRIDSPIKADQRFLDGLVVNSAEGRAYVASGWPGRTLSTWALDGQLQKRLTGLAGRLFLDADASRLYVRDWIGLVTVDTKTGDAAEFQPMDITYPDILLFDAGNRRFYQTQYNSATVSAFDPEKPTTVKAQTLAALMPNPVQQVAVGADGTMLAVAQYSELGNTTVFRKEDGGWTYAKGALPELSLPRIVPATGKPGVFFAFSAEPYSPFGLFRSTDGGRTWRITAKGLTDFRVHDLALSPGFSADGTALLLAGDTGIFQTRDGSETWTQISDVRGVRAAMAGPSAFLILSPARDSQDILAYAPAKFGGLERVGAISNPFYSAVSGLALSPNFAADGTALAAMQNGGLYLTHDGGRTWKRVGPLPETYTLDYNLLFSPRFAADRTIYVLYGLRYYGGRDVRTLLRSTDGGLNWERAANLDPAAFCLTQAPDGQFWMGTADGRVEVLDVTRLTWENAPSPTITPTPPAPPTPAPTPTPIVFGNPPPGMYWPAETFAPLWNADDNLRQALGWALEAQARDTAAALQPFENGEMVWRQDVGEVYALYNGGVWFAFTDTWTPAEPESDPSIIPPEGRLQPVRGFGKVWREQWDVRAQLGWGLQNERGLTAQAQRFEHGWMLRLEGAVYGLVNADIGPAFWQKR